MGGETKILKIVFVEPPKDYWFVMGEYLPPPYGLIQLAAYVEREVSDVDIEIIDCNAKGIERKGLEKRLDALPDIVGISSTRATRGTIHARAKIYVAPALI